MIFTHNYKLSIHNILKQSPIKLKITKDNKFVYYSYFLMQNPKLEFATIPTWIDFQFNNC